MEDLQVSAFTDIAWLCKGTLGRLVGAPTVPAMVICLYPICDLLFVEGLEGRALAEIMIVFVTIWTEGSGLCNMNAVGN